MSNFKIDHRKRGELLKNSPYVKYWCNHYLSFTDKEGNDLFCVDANKISHNQVRLIGDCSRSYLDFAQEFDGWENLYHNVWDILNQRWFSFKIV